VDFHTALKLFTLSLSIEYHKITTTEVIGSSERFVTL